MVFEAEIVADDAEVRTADVRSGGRPGDVARPGAPARVSGRAVAVIIELGGLGPVAVAGRAGRRVVRAGWTTGTGAVSWGRRAVGGATHGHLREQVRLARTAGDRAGLAEWNEHLEKAKDARVERLTNS